MFDATLKVTNIGLIDAYAELFRDFPALTQQIVDREVNVIAPNFLAALKAYPGPVVYPIKWKTAKQRKAFFATDGFGQGIPTRRTNKLADGWKIIVIYQANAITQVQAVNNVPYEQFVTGKDQQPFHTLTGWHTNNQVMDYYGTVLADRVEAAEIKLFYAVEA